MKIINYFYGSSLVPTDSQNLASHQANLLPQHNRIFRCTQYIHVCNYEEKGRRENYLALQGQCWQPIANVIKLKSIHARN